MKTSYPTRKDIPCHLLQGFMRQSSKKLINVFSKLLKFFILKIIVLFKSESARNIDAGVHENLSRIHAFGRRTKFLKIECCFLGSLLDDFINFIFPSKALESFKEIYFLKKW